MHAFATRSKDARLRRKMHEGRTITIAFDLQQRADLAVSIMPVLLGPPDQGQAQINIVLGFGLVLPR